MNKFTKTVIIFVGISSIFVAGFLSGQYLSHQSNVIANSKFALDGLTSSLFMLEQLEKGQSKEVIHILQASTSGQLATVVNSDLYRENESKKFTCFILRNAKEYRNKFGLFQSKEWENMRGIEEFTKVELRTKTFLDQELPKFCPTH